MSVPEGKILWKSSETKILFIGWIVGQSVEDRKREDTDGALEMCLLRYEWGIL